MKTKNDDFIFPEYDNPLVQSWFVNFIIDKLAAKLKVTTAEVRDIYDYRTGIGDRTMLQWKIEFERKILLASHGVVIYRDELKRQRFGKIRVGLSRRKKQAVLSMLHSWDKREDYGRSCHDR